MHKGMKAFCGGLLLALAPITHADTILGLYIGADYWGTSTSGAINSQSSDSSVVFDSNKPTTSYIALEHPIPMVPNVMLRNASLDLTGDSVAGINVYGGSNLTSATASVDQTDAVLYYEILDNGLVSFDIGLNLRKVHGNYKVFSNADTLVEETQFSGYLPMLYAAGEVGIATTGLSVYGDFNALSVGDHSMRDVQAGVAYQFIDNAVIDMSARLGYRKLSIDLQDLDGINSDLSVDGITAGLRVHF
jgi:outer membrane protein